MKNSGVEWIGEIPEDWEVKRGKELFFEINDRCKNPENYPLLSVSEYYGVAPKSEKIDEGDFITHAETLDGYKICQEGDIVQNIMLAWKRATGMSNYEGLISPAYCIYRPFKGVDSKYYHYLFRTDVYADLFKQFSTGIIDSRLRLYPVKFLSLKYAYPPKSTQQHIASYLDKKCGKIEETIQNQQQVIEKLKAYKQSLITEAVTGKIKIQNGKVCGKYESYKDSGVEWIGKIPSEWEVSKFGRFAQVKSNLVDPNLYLEYPQIAPDNIGKGSGKLIDWQTVKDSGVISWNHLFFKGQIVYSKIRPTLNKLIIAPFDGLCSADMYPIETNMYKQFFVYMMLSQYFVEQVGLITRDRVKMPKINQNELSGILITVPTKNEQKEIADYLDKKCTAIDTAIEQKQKLIEKLTEYKKSLIYECVTGKKEV